MTPSELLTLDMSLQTAGVLFFVWLGQRLVDRAASFFFDKKLFEPIYEKVARKAKIYKTQATPIGATFSLSFTPSENMTVSQAIESTRESFELAERSANGKLSIESDYWDGHDREGRVKIQYDDKTEVFDVSIEFTPDTDSIREHPSGNPEALEVGSIGLEIDFDFPFRQLNDSILNLSSVMDFLESGFQDQMRGSFSGGRFVVEPLNSDLKIDDWVEEEKFDISLLLTNPNNGGAEVEFFGNKAVVKSEQRTIDAQTVKYVRELLLNYYL